MHAEVMRPGLIQIKLSAAAKKWIQDQAKEQERSQAWLAARMLEEAVARAQREQGAAQ